MGSPVPVALAKYSSEDYYRSGHNYFRSGYLSIKKIIDSARYEPEIWQIHADDVILVVKKQIIGFLNYMNNLNKHK